MKFTAEFKFIPSLFGAFFISSLSFASFEPLPVGGRAAGMGEAYSAVADDIYSLYYNPAGVMQLNRPEIGSYYSKLYSGLTDGSQVGRTFFGYAQPLGKEGRHGAIGASYLALDLSGLYKEQSIGLTYGREYRHIVNWGVSIKSLQKSIGSDPYTANAINPIDGGSTGAADPLLAKGNSSNALGLDLGLQYRLNKAYALGVAARNINQPDLALGSTKDVAPSVLSVALARHLRSGSLDFEIARWKSSTDNMRFSIGGEHWFKNGIGLRAGGGFGSRNYSSASFGASYRMESIQFDYATILPLQGIQGTLGIQQVSFTVRLGRAPADPIETQLMKEKEDRIRAETEARYAKAERDRLKKQLYALTEEKSQNQQEQERLNAQRAEEELKAQAAAEERRARANAQSSGRSMQSKYAAALTDYNAQVAQGITLQEKKRLLEKILAEFSGKDVDTTTVTRELRSLKTDESKAKKDFDLSMGFYRRLVQQGASRDERRSMLERIIQKYKGVGIDIGSAEEEMKILK